MVHNSLLLRLCGISLILGSLMIIFMQGWFYLDSASFVAAYFDYAGWILITFGMIGLYLVQYRRNAGLFSLSFLLLILSLFQWIGYKWFQTFVVPDLRRDAPEVLEFGLQSVFYGIDASIYALQISLFLFTVVSLFTGVLSRFGLSLLLIGSALAFNQLLEETVLYNPMVPQIMIGVALFWLGLHLLHHLHKEFEEEPLLVDSYEDKKLDEKEADNIESELGTS